MSPTCETCDRRPFHADHYAHARDAGILGVSGDDLRASSLAGDVTLALEAMLASHGFDMAKPIWTVELATGGFVFAQ
jgi:hypothetical protein